MPDTGFVNLFVVGGPRRLSIRAKDALLRPRIGRPAGNP